MGSLPPQRDLYKHTIFHYDYRIIPNLSFYYSIFSLSFTFFTISSLSLLSLPLSLSLSVPRPTARFIGAHLHPGACGQERQYTGHRHRGRRQYAAAPPTHRHHTGEFPPTPSVPATRPPCHHRGESPPTPTNHSPALMPFRQAPVKRTNLFTASSPYSGMDCCTPCIITIQWNGLLYSLHHHHTEEWSVVLPASSPYRGMVCCTPCIITIQWNNLLYSLHHHHTVE